MKKFLLLGAMLVCGMVAKAQFVLTPQVGATLATATDYDDSKMKVGLVAGANLEYPITEAFSVSGGLLYTMQGSAFKDADDKTKLDYLNIPMDDAIVRRGQGSYFAHYRVTQEAYANLLPSDAEVHRDLVFGRSVS